MVVVGKDSDGVEVGNVDVVVMVVTGDVAAVVLDVVVVANEGTVDVGVSFAVAVGVDVAEADGVVFAGVVAVGVMVSISRDLIVELM